MDCLASVVIFNVICNYAPLALKEFMCKIIFFLYLLDDKELLDGWDDEIYPDIDDDEEAEFNIDNVNEKVNNLQ